MCLASEGDASEHQHKARQTRIQYSKDGGTVKWSKNKLARRAPPNFIKMKRRRANVE